MKNDIGKCDLKTCLSDKPDSPEFKPNLHGLGW